MAYAITSSPANLGAVLDALYDFMVDPAIGWTGVTDPGGSGTVLRAFKGSQAIEIEIDSRTGTALAVKDGTSFSGTTLIGPSGNGGTGSSSRRTVFDGTGPYDTVWFFGDDATSNVHCVLKQADSRFRHFAGFGLLENKAGDWTGGEYAYCHLPDTSSSAALEPQTSDSQVLLDCGYDVNTTTDADRAPTLRCSGLPGHAGTWGVVGDPTMDLVADATLGSRARIIGGTRGGPLVNALGWNAQSAANQFVAVVPIDVWYLRPLSTAISPDTPDDNQSSARRLNSKIMLLGRMPQVGTIQMGTLASEQVITLGLSPSTEEWQVFPAVLDSDFGSNRSNNFGIAYKRGSLITP